MSDVSLDHTFVRSEGKGTGTGLLNKEGMQENGVHLSRG